MPNGIGKKKMESKYLNFTETGRSQTGKTAIFDVVSKNGNHVLGKIAWYGNWRKYCFYTAAAAILDENCLGDISSFIEEQTRKQKEPMEERVKRLFTP